MGSILVYIWHVKIVHEVNKDLVGWGSIGLTSSLINVSFDNLLESLGVSVTVEVERGIKNVLFVKSGEVVLNDGGLTGTGRTDIENTLLGLNVHVEKESLSGGLSSRDHNVVEETLGGRLVFRNFGLPEDPIKLYGIEEVVPNLIIGVRELNF